MLGNDEEETYITRLTDLLKTIQNGKLAARTQSLEQMFKIFAHVSQVNAIYLSTFGQGQEDLSQSFDEILQWFWENDALGALLRDNLHLTAYVDRIEKVLQILLKKQVFTTAALEQTWNSLIGKHDAVQRNMLLMIAKLARFMTAELIDKLFDLIKNSFKAASSLRERSLLLDFCRNLITNNSVLTTFPDISKMTFDLVFDLYHDKELSMETVDMLLNVQVTAMSVGRNADELKRECLYKCLEEINSDTDLALPMFLHIQNCCSDTHDRKARFNVSRHMINVIISANVLSVLVGSICRYMDKVRSCLQPGVTLENPDVYMHGSFFSHRIHINSRIDCLNYFVSELAERQYYLDDLELQKFWNSIIENPVCEYERLRGFMFYGSNICRFPHKTNLYFFHNCLIKFPTRYFTVSSFNEICIMLKRSTAVALICESDQRMSNRETVENEIKIEEFLQKARAYLWKIILDSPDSVAFRAIEFATCEMENSSDADQRNVSAQNFIDECFGQLETIDKMLRQICDDSLKDQLSLRSQRVIKALKVLLVRYENVFRNRINPPLYRASMGRCENLAVLICKDDGNAPLKKMVKVNSNFTMRYFQTILENLIGQERNMNVNERIDILNYRIQPGMSMYEAHVRAAQLLQSMRNDRLPSMHSALHDVFRYAGKESMKRTLGELFVDETTITAVRFSRSKRDTTSYNFVSSMTRGDTPDNSDDDNSDDERILVKDDEFEMQPIILSKNKERIYFLMDFADLAHKLKKYILRDAIIATLDHLTVTDAIKFTVEKAILDNKLKEVIVVDSPTRTCFNFQVLQALLTPAVPSDAFNQVQSSFLYKNCIKQFCEFFDSNVLAGPMYFPALHARILLSFARMVKFVSDSCVKIQDYFRSNDLDDDMHVDDRLDDVIHDNYFTRLTVKAVKIAFDQESKAVLFEHADNFLVSPTILKLLLFSSWSATRGNVAALSYGKPPVVMQEVDDDVMETNSMSSVDSDSSFASSFIDDVMFTKTNDKNEFLCETLAVEALEAFIGGSRFCPEVDAFFHTPIHLLTGSIIMTEQTLLNPSFYEFAVDGMLHSISERVRHKVARSIFDLLQHFPETAGEDGPKANALLNVLFKNLPVVENNYMRSCQYFNCMYQLLNHCQEQKIDVHDPLEKLDQLVTWLKNAKTAAHNTGLTYHTEQLLVPYLRMTTHLLRAIPQTFSNHVGARGSNLLAELFDDFLVPFSRAYHAFVSDEDYINSSSNDHIDCFAPSSSESHELIQKPSKTMPICKNDCSIFTCFDLISEIVRNNSDNLMEALSKVNQSFYDDFGSPITNDLPMPFLQRDPTVFVGLKNAGATCYMNSVLQQLFMIEPFRHMILEAKLDFSEQREIEGLALMDKRREKYDYSKELIECVQRLFAHLLASDEQFYVPLEFWDTFQLGGREINTHEQQDAVEFFNSLADVLDESFKLFGGSPLFEKFFGGTFADQKKCKDCPHVYTTEQLFTSIAVDIRSHNTLTASLNEYVTGDLLEGDNAYFCELCQQKVTAVKRMCFEKLPPYLMFQLKRFDIDWNKGSPVKFFDYFEFPMNLDMEPFTTVGVERKENLNSPTSSVINVDTTTELTATKYRLRGVVVHSGEANGGHYYSFIADNKEDGRQQWYQFDDTDVSAWDYTDADARHHWFGGSVDLPFVSEKDKRRFSAYMLVYELMPSETSVSQQMSVNTCVSSPPSHGMPSPNMNSMDLRFNSMSLHSKRAMANRLPPKWERSVTKSNLKFAHQRFQFSYPYFKFIRDLTRIAMLQCTVPGVFADRQMVAHMALKTFGCFIYSTGIRCPNDLKKTNMDDWYFTFNTLIEYGGPEVCLWFIDNILTRSNVIHVSLLASITNASDIRNLLEKMIQLPVMECIAASELETNPQKVGAYERAVDDVLRKIAQSSKNLNIDFAANPQLMTRLKNMATPVKLAKKRHVTPPHSDHDSNSSLPSYEAMPTSRKVRHEQSPHTSPVKLPALPASLPTYEECINTTNDLRSDSMSPMYDSSHSQEDYTYTGECSSDGPPSA